MFPSSTIFLSREVIIENRSLLPLINEKVETEIFLVKVIFWKKHITKESNVIERVVVQNEKTAKSTFGELYIRMHSNSTIYNKSYRKLDEFLAYLGGFLKIALLIIGKIKILISY